MADYASAWQAADKVVYSSTLAVPRTTNTRLERHFDPSAVRDLKAAASRDLLVGGPNLAAQAFVAGLVDELALFVWPVVLGGRTPALPTDLRVDLKLIDEHRFSQRRRPPPLSPSVTTQGPRTLAHLPPTAGSVTRHADVRRIALAIANPSRLPVWVATGHAEVPICAS
jgi:RibD C-terminal domain